MVDWKQPFKELPVGKERKICDGQDIAILSFGHPGNFVVEANKIFNYNELQVAHYDMRYAKPLDNELLHEAFTRYKKIITVEDGCLQGGFGSAVLEWAADNNYKNQVMRLGIPDYYIEHGEQHEQWEEAGFDTKSIVNTVSKMLDVKVKTDPLMKM